MTNKDVTVCDGWSVEAQSDTIMRINEHRADGISYSMIVDKRTYPQTFAFLQALHAEHYELNNEDEVGDNV